MTLSPWFFFVFVVRWVCAVFGALAAAVTIMIILVAVVAQIRDAL